MNYFKEIHAEYLPTDESEVLVVVLTYPQDSVADFSIFSQIEWNTLLAISQRFEDESHKASWYSAWEYQQLSDEVRDSIYFLKYKCVFCEDGFSRLETLRGTKADILNFILESSRFDLITTNKIRKWVANSWDVLIRILTE